MKLSHNYQPVINSFSKGVKSKQKICNCVYTNHLNRAADTRAADARKAYSRAADGRAADARSAKTMPENCLKN